MSDLRCPLCKVSRGTRRATLLHLAEAHLVLDAYQATRCYCGQRVRLTAIVEMEPEEVKDYFQHFNNCPAFREQVVRETLSR